MQRTRSRTVRKPPETEVVNLYSKFSVSQDDSSGDEDYEPGDGIASGSDSEAEQMKDDSQVEANIEEDSKSGDPDIVEEATDSPPEADPVAKQPSTEVVAPLIMGFGKTRSGRKIVPSQNFDILYLATKFGATQFESDDSADEDFQESKEEQPSINIDSCSDESSLEEEPEGSEKGSHTSMLTEGTVLASAQCQHQGKTPISEGELPLDGRAIDKEGGSEGAKSTPLCCICLSEGGDDVLTCDRCYWSAHEDCYGVPPLESDTNSDEEELPWLCDACKCSIHPSCELCPNSEGLFKQTVNGKWIHTVCSLFTPGVTYLQPDKLSCVVLDEVLPQRWGQKTCLLCKDSVLAKTGVCISCDAGMCRSAFHVTCAQQNGLLCETDMSQEEIEKKDTVIDAYFAHCKLHSKKEDIKRKVKTWVKVAKQRIEKKSVSLQDSQTMDFLTESYKEYSKDLNDSGIVFYHPANCDLVQERFLHVSPSALKMFSRKAKVYGRSIEVGVIKKAIKRPKPSLSLEFFQYYKERDTLLVNLRKRNNLFEEKQKALQLEEKELLKRINDREAELKQLSSVQHQLIQSCLDIYAPLGLSPPRNLIQGKDSYMGGSIRSCCICMKSVGTHQMVQCDTCKLHYHIYCLDPPLSKVPKKSRNYGWQCEECDAEYEDNEDIWVELNSDHEQLKRTPLVASRQKRTITKTKHYT